MREVLIVGALVLIAAAITALFTLIGPTTQSPPHDHVTAYRCSASANVEWGDGRGSWRPIEPVLFCEVGQPVRFRPLR